MLGNLSSITAQSYARQLNILTNQTTGLKVFLVFNTLRFGRSVTDWLVENITYDISLYRVSLDVSA